MAFRSFLASDPDEVTIWSSSPSRCSDGALLSPERSPRSRPPVVRRSYKWNRPRRSTPVTHRPFSLWPSQSSRSTQRHTWASPGASRWCTRSAISRWYGPAPTARSPAPATSQRIAVSVSYHSAVAPITRQSFTASSRSDGSTRPFAPYEHHEQVCHAPSERSTASTRARSWLCPSNADTILPATWPSA